MLAIIWASTLFFCLIASLFNFQSIKFRLGSYSLTTKGNNDYIYLFLTSIVFIIIFLLITSNRTGADIINYFNSYKYKHDILGREILYNSLKEYFYINDFTFFEFRAIITFFSGLLVYYTFVKLKVDIYLFSLLYMPMLLFIDSMQFRNSISMCILIFAIYTLISNKSIYTKYLFVLLIFVAAQIHTVYIFYLCLLFFDSKYEKVITKLVMIGTIILVIVTLVNGNKPPFIETIFSFVLSDNDDRLTRYLTRGNLGFVLPTILHFFSIFMITILEQNKKSESINFYQSNLLNIVQWSNYITLFFIPLTMMNMNFYRMLRNNFYLSLILVVGLIRTSNYSKRTKLMTLVILIFLTFLWLLFEMYYNSTSLWKPVFEGELFWK